MLQKQRSGKKISIQKEAYASLIAMGFPNDLQKHASEHICRLTGLDSDQIEFNMESTFKAMRKIRKHEAMQVVKTWCNSWATSYRYHEDPLLPCLFGCTGIDDLSHYINCPLIWTDVQSAFPQLVFDSASQKLCVDTDCTESLRVLAAVFQAYHTIKPTYACLPLAPSATVRYAFFEAFCTAAQSSGLVRARAPSASHD